MNCIGCGKEIPGEGMTFCPYCGTRIAAAEERKVSGEAAEWIAKAMKKTSLPDRRIILEKAKEACPEDPAIDWELLFIGTPDPKPKRGTIDFSIIKSWVLQMYRNPGDFSAEKKDAMRRELFDSPQLLAVLEMYEDPARKHREYLERLCREYVDIFLKEDNRLTGTFFGLRLGRNLNRLIGETMETMAERVGTDEKLTAEQKQMLQEAMRKALNG